MPRGKFFYFCYGVILVFLIILLGSKVQFIFRPLVVLVQTLFAPIIIAGVLFYLSRPFVNLLSRWMPRGISILILYLSAISIFTMLILLIGPELQIQFNSLVKNMPLFVNEMRDLLIQVQENEWVARFQQNENYTIEEITSSLVEYLNELVSAIGSNVATFIGFITNIIIIMIIIPFVLFYMLKEGEKAPQQVIRLLPVKQQQEGRHILSDMDTALSSYIQGQIIVSICVGVLCYIGFLIIGLDYPLVLALIAMFTNVIPFVGPWIGTIPSVIVGLLHSPLMVLLVIIVVIIVQQVESNLISPQVMGRKLAIHPLTIILLLLVAGRYAGLLGLLLAVPTYAVGKVIVSHTYRLWKLKKYPIE
ncbi:AI-2E family transporter [Alkalihalophilus pseudofirmus]|uniref:AI-2E family transporter n=1 Tax=Alkalihalobacterium alkalinitrilicum TaxID=427920 RepID=UPI00094C39F7|nr:AI-2E family transporter [Alkalihalobacterium alkalinitrilicum]OLO40622.1 AI-2E family transporter [Alkalihalophilus pseudofirmus]